MLVVMAPRRKPAQATHISKSSPRGQTRRSSDGGSSRPQPPSHTSTCSAVTSAERSSTAVQTLQLGFSASSSSPPSPSATPLPAAPSEASPSDSAASPSASLSQVDSQPATSSSSLDSPLVKQPRQRSELASDSTLETSEPSSAASMARENASTRSQCQFLHRSLALSEGKLICLSGYL